MKKFKLKFSRKRTGSSRRQEAHLSNLPTPDEQSATVNQLNNSNSISRSSRGNEAHSSDSSIGATAASKPRENNSLKPTDNRPPTTAQSCSFTNHPDSLMPLINTLSLRVYQREA